MLTANRSQARRRPPRPWRVALTVTKTALASAVVVAMLGTQITGTATATNETDQTTSVDPLSARIDALMVRERCSYTGFGADVIPASALLRTDRGDVRIVSFARGWAAYEGKASGTLIAVCRGR
ncbi:hypothetical protein GCM10022215_27210 [Nocardioides fonticola]|uniref:Uncharacterized protein n=1 Tax=Nocardioides fonticola TaxID=450363 RepID=A0ABP7XMT7_9ACTN